MPEPAARSPTSGLEAGAAFHLRGTSLALNPVLRIRFLDEQTTGGTTEAVPRVRNDVRHR
jgi:hypothetical protein